MQLLICSLSCSLSRDLAVAALQVYERLDAAGKSRLGSHWRQRQLPSLLQALVGALPLDELESAPPITHNSVAAACAAGSPSLGELAVVLYCQMLRSLPSLVRHWWSHELPSRAASAALARFTEARASPMLLRQEIEAISNNSERLSGDNFKVRGSVATRQIAASYSCEGSAMQIVLQLSTCHPLRTVDVECAQMHSELDFTLKPSANSPG